MREALILDYTDYVELTCEEENGTYRSYPSRADVVRSAYRFINPHDIPPDPFAIPYECVEKVNRLWFEYNRARHELFGQWNYYGNCPFCNNPLNNTYEPKELIPSHLEEIFINTCSLCGWWESDEKLYPASDTGRSVHRRGVLREFAVAGSEVPIDTLRQYIMRHPDALHDISPFKLEKLVASIFSEFMNCEAIHVGGPNDGGIDIVLVEGDRRYVIQVKRRQSRKAAESVKGIREFLGAMVLQGEMKGLFVSTAPRFSPQAVAAAMRAKEKALVEYIELITPKRLIDVCKLTTAEVLPPWKRVASISSDLLEHINPGFEKFRELAIGHPDWRGF